MLRKPDHYLGALPISRKQVSCDFTGMRGARSRPITIRHLPAPDRAISQGFSLAIARDLSRPPRRLNPIRSYPMEKMRGTPDETRVRKQNTQRDSRPIARKQKRGGPGTHFTARFARVIFDFVLLYLTLVTIFVNRHGPLKKFDTGRAAETLSAVNP